MSDKKVFTARDGALFTQEDPAHDAEYAGCYDLGDLTQDEGGIELLQAFDTMGNYEVLNHTEDAPSAIEFDLTTWLGKASEYFENVKLPFYLHINQRCGGVANVINNYERAQIVKVVKRTKENTAGQVMRNEDAETEQGFSFAAYPPKMNVYHVVPARQTTTETENARDLIFVKESVDSNCGLPRFKGGSIGMYVYDAAAGVAANVEYTLDGGSTIAACAADPFAADENIASVTYVWLDRKRIRFIVSRGTTDAGNPAEIAYTDFNLETDTAIGAAWTLANVGTTNAQFFFGPKSLYAYDLYNIWGVAGAGYIYKSADAGVTWTTQEAGVLFADDYYVVKFKPGSKLHGYVCGENNAMAKTHDGGITWSAVTGPSAADELISMDIRSEVVVRCGNNTGELWVTFNGGLSWTQITNFVGTGVGQVRAVEFLNDVQGFMLTNTAAPVGTLHMTRDCGRSWEALTTPDNDGLNSLDLISSALIFGCGNTETVSNRALLLRASA
jgi:photosystem II stability/assembly factor-like uncharacterized protein